MAVETASDLVAAQAAVLELAARWTPDALAATLADALDLAAWEGREAVFAESEGEAGATPTAFAARPGRLVFREQVEFLRQKRPLPSRSWREVLHGMHDRAFVVAGVTDTVMLEDIQAALVTAAAEGQSLADFTRVADAAGWGFSPERLRTIFETNMRTSFMAGRLKQMRQPAVTKLRPFWQYLHGVSRIPKMPRKQHLGWHGLVLRWDDPWWQTHFPPNGWGCSCGVRTLSARDLERLGKSGPDPTPVDALVPAIDRASGQMVMRTLGVDPGWHYMPGDHWARGLAPRLADEGSTAAPSLARHLVEIDTPSPLAELIERARNFSPAARRAAEQLQALIDPTPEQLVKPFFDAFGFDPDKGGLFEDKSGHRLPITSELFRDAAGAWKVGKRHRGLLTPYLAETLIDPDEIWLGLIERRRGIEIDRRYIRVDPELGLLVVFELGRTRWEPITAHSLTRKGNDRPDFARLHLRRGGKLVWRRRK